MVNVYIMDAIDRLPIEWKKLIWEYDADAIELLLSGYFPEEARKKLIAECGRPITLKRKRGRRCPH